MTKTRLLLGYAFLLIGCSSMQNETAVIEKIKTHYGNIHFNGISVDYKRISYNPYQSYDHRNPDSIISHSFILLDGGDFFSESSVSFPGGFNFAIKEFQHDSVGYFYDTNGVLYGRRAIPQGPERLVATHEELAELLDFKFSQKILPKLNSLTAQIDNENNEIHLIGGDSLELNFQIEPVALKSVSYPERNEKWAFSDYTMTGDIRYAQRVAEYDGLRLKADYFVERVAESHKIPASYFVLPDSIHVHDSPPPPTSLEKIGDDLFLIKSLPGDRNIMFSVHESEITVYGAPLSDGISERVITLIQEQFPKHKIARVYVTHAHSDHIRGLKAYVDLGIPILTDSISIATIKDFPRYKESIKSFVFELLEEAEPMDNVSFYLVENSHCLSQSFAYFKDYEVIYQGDFLEIPADNTLPNYIPKTTVEFYQFLMEKELVVSRIVGHHRNDNISMETFREYFSKFN